MGLYNLVYRDAIDALFARTGGRIKPGLERTRSLLGVLGDPQKLFPSFHVAGTNGKGSVCATLDALLRFQGLKVGKYSSPHLVDFRERITINGEAIPEEDVVQLIGELAPESERIGATFFEITTALAFAYFARQKVDIAVIETGLGGRFDSTNVLDPLVATVTNINFDHTSFLGNTLDQIAFEKAGIFKRSRPVVIGDTSVGITTQLLNAAQTVGASSATIVRNDWIPKNIDIDAAGTSFDAVTPLGATRLTTPLLGEFQSWNTMTALATLHTGPSAYHLSIDSWNEALANVRLPGRFQRAGDWIFDVAHNPAGAQVLAKTLSSASIEGLRNSFVRSEITVVLGILVDKEWRGMIEALAPVATRIIITQPTTAPADRAWDVDKVISFVSDLGLEYQREDDFRAAIELAKGTEGLKVVTGSFHTVGDAMLLLGIDPLKF